MANVNLSAVRLSPIGGVTNGGLKLGFIETADKAAQNDTWTVNNAVEVKDVTAVVIATGVSEPCTISGNVITLTSATTGACRAQIVYR